MLDSISLMAVTMVDRVEDAERGGGERERENDKTMNFCALLFVTLHDSVCLLVCVCVC